MTGDIFVLAQSWQPDFCYGQPTYAGCATPNADWNKYFTLHGLWPQYSAGSYPADCTTEAFDTSIPQTIGLSTMLDHWPNVKEAVGSEDYDSFWDHEWSKHGTCTGLSQHDYFTHALDLLKKFGTPALMTKSAGGTVDAASLRNAFGGATMVALQCSSDSYINGAYTCWTQENGVPTKQIVCPDDVQKEDTCTSETLTIRTFSDKKM